MKKSKERDWSELDNLAKIFPSTSSKKDPKVFRFAVELIDDINPDFLQDALDETINIFPIFKSVIKRGMFWYYLEESEIKPLVQIENLPPCSAIYTPYKEDLLFRVNYYKRRINLEVYHALTDGTGALQFLRILIFKYVIKKYKKDFKTIPSLEYDVSSHEREIDSFNKYYNPKNKKQKLKIKKAHQIKGKKYKEGIPNIICGKMNVKDVLNMAHKYNTTLTVFLTSLFIYSIEMEMRVLEKKNPIVISIPVNLRNYFESKSIRNFFGLIHIKYNVPKKVKLEDITKSVDKSFKKELTEEKIQERINTFAALENNMFVKPVPIYIKDIAIKLSDKVLRKDTTATLSNVGKIDMPEEIKKYINFIDVFMSNEKIQVCVCSYEEYLSISFTTMFKSTNIQKNFYRILTDMGIEVEISSTIS